MWPHFRTNFEDRYIEMRMCRVNLSMRTEGIKAFSNGSVFGDRFRRCSVDVAVSGAKRISVDGAKDAKI